VRIEKDQVIAGISAIAAKAIMRHIAVSSGGTVTLGSMQASFTLKPAYPYKVHEFAMNKAKMARVLEAFCDEGFLEKDSTDRKDKGFSSFSATIKGGALGMASTRKAISKDKATTLIQEFLERCAEVKADVKHLYYPSKVMLFGSMTGSSPEVNDIDILLELSPKLLDREAHRAACESFTEEAKRNGKHFKTIILSSFWAEMSTAKFLKGTSSRLSFHTQMEIDQITKQAEMDGFLLIDLLNRDPTA
jgi:predicted nucleotidyltransferase